MTPAAPTIVTTRESLDAVLAAAFVGIATFVVAAWLSHGVPVHAVPWIK